MFTITSYNYNQPEMIPNFTRSKGLVASGFGAQGAQGAADAHGTRGWRQARWRSEGRQQLIGGGGQNQPGIG